MNAPVVSESPGRAELVFALGVGLLLLSGMLPWITASEAIPVADPSEQAEGLNSFSEADTSEEILGIDRVDWVVLTGVGLVATVLVVTEPWSRVVLAVAGASGLAAVGLGAVYLVDPAWMYSDWLKSEVGAVASAGPGVYLALASGVVQFGGIYLGVTESKSTTGAQQLDAPAQTDSSPRTQPPGDQQPRGPPQSPQGQSPNDQPPQNSHHQENRQPQQNRQPPNNGPPQNDQQPQGRQPERGQQPPPHSQSADEPTDRSQNRQPDQSPPAQRRESERPPSEGGTDPSEDAANHTAGDARQGTGSGQQPTESEQSPQAGEDHSSDESDREQ